MRAYCAAILLVLVALGCQPGAKGVWDSKTTITTDLKRDGSITLTIDRDAEAKAEVISPKNASTAPALSINEAGIDAQGSAEWEEKAIDWVTKNTKVYYIASIICFGAAVLVFWLWHQHVAAVMLGALGGLFMFAPSLVKYFGRTFAYLVGGLIIAAIVAIITKSIQKWRENKRAAQTKAKMIDEGHLEVAAAIDRQVDPMLEKEIQKRKAAKAKLRMNPGL